MVGDTILKPGANAFLTPILFAYRPKIFIFALRRSVSELVLGGQSASKFFSIVFKCEFLIFGENFHLFFLSKFWFLIPFPKFHCKFVILVYFLVNIACLGVFISFLVLKFYILSTFSGRRKKIKIFQIRSNQISWTFEKPH